MSRKSRRKTLSHAEIENFLFDLQEESDLKSTVIADVESEETSEALPLDEVTELKSIIRAIYKDMSKGSITESANPEMCCKAKKIADISSYIILPSRIVYPERYMHPNNSLEAKKALLMSMSPMLADAEKQKKIDSTSCEEFTRCRVGKARTRHSTYEYIDIDTNLKLTPLEYSQRYMMYIYRNRETSDVCPPKWVGGTITTSFEGVAEVLGTGSPLRVECEDGLEEEGAASSTQSLDVPTQDNFLWCDDDDKEDDAKQTYRGNRAKSRRMTISPSRCKEILDDELHEFEEENSGETATNDTSEGVKLEQVEQVALCNQSCVPIPERVSSEEGAEIASTHSSSPLSSLAMSEEEEEPDTVDEIMETRLSKSVEKEADNDRVTSVPVPSASLGELESSHEDTILSFLSTDIDQATRNALNRYHLRTEIARWKYMWEIASIHAAQAALSKVESPHVN